MVGRSVLALMFAVLVLRHGISAENEKSEDTKAATSVVESFRDHLKEGKVDEAFTLLTEIPKAPDQFAEKMKGKLSRIAASYREGKRGLEVVEVKVDGDCAVAAIRETKSNVSVSKDYDPIYLVKRDGKWRILPGISQYDTSRIGLDTGLDDAALKRFAGLSAWFKEFKKKAREQ